MGRVAYHEDLSLEEDLARQVGLVLRLCWVGLTGQESVLFVELQELHLSLSDVEVLVGGLLVGSSPVDKSPCRH